MRYVYKLQNVINGKTYIGQTKTPALRKAGHFSLAKRGDNRLLYASIRKHGRENFSFEVIEECDDAVINEREQFWVAHFDSFNPEKGYNLTRGGQNLEGCERPRTKEHREKMSIAAKSYWSSATDDRRQLVVNKNKSNAGRQASRNAQYRRWSDPSQKKAMSNRLKGQPKTDEQKRKLSEAMKKRWNDPNYRYLSKPRGRKKGVKMKPRDPVTCSVCGNTFKALTNTHIKACHST